jgi:pSer/pThr/pTyr-binding forkhead associated (FHA) protein
MTLTPVLICTAGELLTGTWEIPEEGSVEIGRADSNTIVLPDDGVSRFHARILYEEGALWLQDAGSRNGVFHNNRRVTGHQKLKPGDEISVALHTFQVRSRLPDGSFEPLEDGESAESIAASQPTDGKKRRWFWPFG